MNISVWPAAKIDREITSQVNASASAHKDASQTKKNLFAGTSLRADIEKFAARVRLYNNQHTLPWADKGERMLPTKLFMDYKQTMNGYERTFNMLCDNFFDEYERLVEEAKVNLGSMYKAEDYPDLTNVRTKFSFKRSVKPLPEAGDFRLDIPAHDLEEMRSAYEVQYSEKLADAMRTPWERLHEVLLGMSKKLEGSGDEKKRYHDSLITNPLELCELLTKLNVTNDPKLEDARRQVELAMLGADIEEVKDSPLVRENLKSKVDAILGKFEW